MTKELFREDSYLRQCQATVTAVSDTGFQTDQSVFYPHGGGQLGDIGTVTCNGQTQEISNTVKDRDTGDQWHILTQRPLVNVGDEVELALDWERRYKLMRFHSCLHMLCALIDAPVTSGSIQVDRARLDFDLKDPIDKKPITAGLNELVERNVKMTTRWITDAELDAQPELVRTMSVQPPRNASGTIRLVEFEAVDLQPCGGTHVASSGEIGRVRVSKTEKKGKQNRRIIVVFDD